MGHLIEFDGTVARIGIKNRKVFRLKLPAHQSSFQEVSVKCEPGISNTYPD